MKLLKKGTKVRTLHHFRAMNDLDEEGDGWELTEFEEGSIGKIVNRDKDTELSSKLAVPDEYNPKQKAYLIEFQKGLGATLFDNEFETVKISKKKGKKK